MVAADVFPGKLRDDLTIVREVIPWTKKIKERIVLADGTEVDARPHLLSHKDSLVIKHANAYSSAAVFLGEDADADRWQVPIIPVGEKEDTVALVLATVIDALQEQFSATAEEVFE